ncbi:hypothetical protein AAHC03_05828 [Spirometra sp. Aus1]
MVSQQTFLSLNSGYQLPQVGFGTYMVGSPFILFQLQSTPDKAERPVLWAIDAGYRHIDCAHIYGNEVEVGMALKKKFDDATLKREDIFITSKAFRNRNLISDICMFVSPALSLQVKEGRQYSLDDPGALEFEDIPLEETWKGMEQLVEAGLVRSVGVSNFNKNQLDRILASCKIPPALNQIEVSVNWLNQKLIDYCHSKGVQVTAFSPFRSPDEKTHIPPTVEEEYVKKIALTHGKSPAQVLLRHAIQRDISVLAGSMDAEMIRENFKVFDFALTKEEMEVLNTSGRNTRFFTAKMAVGHPEYPFQAEF